MRNRVIASLASVATIALAGCGKPWNESIDLVGTAPLPALSESEQGVPIRDQPSLAANFDRRGWSVVDVEVPIEQTAHYPDYTFDVHWRGDRGPWDPAYPAGAEAIVDETDAADDTVALFGDPVAAAANLVWLPIDAVFVHWPWTRQTSPKEPGELLPPAPPMSLWDWFTVPSTPSIWRQGHADQPAG